MKKMAVLFLAAFAAVVTMTGCQPMLFEGKTLDMNWATTHDGPMACKGELYEGAGGADVVLKRTKLIGSGAWVTYTQRNPDGSNSIFGPIKLADGEKCLECLIPPGLVLVGGGVLGGVAVPMIIRGAEDHLAIPMGGPMLVSGLVQFSTEEGPFAFTLKGAAYRPTSPEGEGEPVQYVDIPDLTGMNLTQLIAVFTNSCLIMAPPTYVTSETVPAGIIVSWRPVDGTVVQNGKVPCGTRILIVMSSGPTTGGEPLSVTITKPTDPASVTVGQPLSVEALVKGSHKLEVKIVMPNGTEAPTQEVLPPATVSFSALMDVVGGGNITVQAKDLTTGQVIVASRDVTVNPAIPQTGIVPDLAGLTEGQARAVVAPTCLIVGTVNYQYHPTNPAGTVTDWSPKGEVVCGTAVNIVVSKGLEPSTTATVPNVVGLPKVAAMTTITAAGLVVGTITESYSATVAIGLVISSMPSAGTVVDLESAVALVVSKGPEPTAVFGLTVSSPSDGAPITDKATVVGTVTGPNPVNIVVVSPDGQVYRVEGVTPTYDLRHEFDLYVAGTGLFTVRVTDLVTHEVLEVSRAVTVTLTH